MKVSSRRVPVHLKGHNVRTTSDWVSFQALLYRRCAPLWQEVGDSYLAQQSLWQPASRALFLQQCNQVRPGGGRWASFQFLVAEIAEELQVPSRGTRSPVLLSVPAVVCRCSLSVWDFDFPMMAAMWRRPDQNRYPEQYPDFLQPGGGGRRRSFTRCCRTSWSACLTPTRSTAEVAPRGHAPRAQPLHHATMQACQTPPVRHRPCAGERCQNPVCSSEQLGNRIYMTSVAWQQSLHL